MPQSSYTLPVTVPVGYSDSSLLQSSPHMGQTSSVSPRPSSSEADSGLYNSFFLLKKGLFFKFIQNHEVMYSLVLVMTDKNDIYIIF